MKKRAIGFICIIIMIFTLIACQQNSSTIIGKCDRYRDYYRSGLEQKQFGVFPVVVWLVLDAGRKERLRSAIQEAYPKGGKLFIVITADEFERLIRQGCDAKDLC